MKLKKGEIVFEQASNGKDVFFILKGGIEISISNEKLEQEIDKRKKTEEELNKTMFDLESKNNKISEQIKDIEVSKKRVRRIKV